MRALTLFGGVETLQMSHLEKRLVGITDTRLLKSIEVTGGRLKYQAHTRERGGMAKLHR